MKKQEMSKPFRFRHTNGTETMVSANSINRIERAEDGMAALHVSNQLVRTAEPADYVWAQLLGVGRYLQKP